MIASRRSWILIVLGLAAGALADQRSAGAQQNAARESDAGANRHRVECFELRSAADGPAVGFASLHRTDALEGTLLEWQISFPNEGLNIFHAESCDDNGQRWVWRESQARRSRSVIAAQSGPALDVTEWGRPRPWRSQFPVSDSGAFPLELEERLRADEMRSGNFALFDPLANEVESVRLVVGGSQPNHTEDLRRAELVRDDGSLAGSWTFHGAELVSFSWQRGGLIAVRVDRDRFAEHTLQASLDVSNLAPAPGRR